VSSVNGERGLPDSGHPLNGVNAHRATRFDRGIRQLPEFLLSPGERGHIPWE
jgi:hypothetical protein